MALTVCVDLDGTITKFPVVMCALMGALRDAGHCVVVLTGDAAETATESAVEDKRALLSQLGCADAYTTITVVANPKNKVADLKVAYMRQVGADLLIDNDHKNVRAARKAGFLALRPGRT